jgi:hypothetical protein
VISPLVFSRDRPAQLDLLLRSLETNAAGLVWSPIVLYRATDSRYARGYELCFTQHRETRFVPEREGQFEQQVRRLLHTVGALGFVMCLCDDDVVYQSVATLGRDPVEVLETRPDVLCFSLRLGLNTQVCYPLARRHADLALAPLGKGTQTWDWTQATEGDFSYPASLDGNIFRTGDLLQALQGETWHNPNSLEDALVRGLRTLNPRRPFMASHFMSSLVGIPLNRTTQTHQTNRVADIAGASLEEMNERYLGGERLAPGMVEAALVDAAHCEFAPVWENGFSSREIPKTIASASGV